MVLFWDVFSSSNSIPEMQKCIQDFKQLRPYYYGDYYPLTGTEKLMRDDGWLAYQLNRPEKGDGVILAFRRKNCGEVSLVVKLSEIDQKSDYELISEYPPIRKIKRGVDLVNGFTLISEHKPGSLLIWYQKLD